MKKYIFHVFVGLTFISQTFAQDSLRLTTNFKDTVAVKPDTSYWQRSFAGGVNFNQASFSNWSGEGSTP